MKKMAFCLILLLGWVIASEPLSKSMIENRAFYSVWEEGSPTYIETRFLPDPAPTVDGKVIFKMLSRERKDSGDIEEVYYRIFHGQLYIFANDGSMTRYTLLRKTPEKWILKEEEDTDGFEKNSEFVPRGNVVWFLQKPAGYPDFDRCIPVPDDPLMCKIVAGNRPAGVQRSDPTPQNPPATRTQAPPSADCSRWPGSVPGYFQGKFGCICPEGTKLNHERNACIEKNIVVMKNGRCTGGREAVQDGGRTLCQCPGNQWWSDILGRCASYYEYDQACKQRYPGSEPSDTPPGDCQCPDGSRWSADRSRCLPL
jgi:hypothetical protein